MSEHSGAPDALAAALFSRRVLLVRGALDDRQASDLAAALMTLDASGDEGIELRLASASSGLEPAMMLLDVISVLGVPVRPTAIGSCSGGAVALLAAGAAPRRIGEHSRLVLREPDFEVAGRAREIEQALAAHAARRDDFFAELASATRRRVEDVAAEWVGFRSLEAADALSLGYADEIEGRPS